MGSRKNQDQSDDSGTDSGGGTTLPTGWRAAGDRRRTQEDEDQEQRDWEDGAPALNADGTPI